MVRRVNRILEFGIWIVFGSLIFSQIFFVVLSKHLLVQPVVVVVLVVIVCPTELLATDDATRGIIVGNLESSNRQLSEAMMTMWTNFAKTG